MATKEDLEFFNRHCQGKTRLKYEMKSYQEMVVNQIRQMSKDNQQLLYFKNKRSKKRYRAKLAIQDESGRINLEAFDHVLLPVATVNPKKPGIPRYYFPRAFDPITGKNIMYIFEKRKHNPTLIGEVYELLCVSDDPKVINHFVKKGFCNPPSKMHFKFVNEECNLMKPKMQDSIVSDTDKVFADYMVPMAALSPMCEPGESSEGGARLSTIQERQCKQKINKKPDSAKKKKRNTHARTNSSPSLRPSLLNVEPPSSIAVAVCPPYHTYAVLPLLPPSPSSDSEETGKLEVTSTGADLYSVFFIHSQQRIVVGSKQQNYYHSLLLCIVHVQRVSIIYIAVFS
ncbi:Protein SUPPRESSOR OF GENE SILENCING [Trifolium repens]|nr:Protein SUPPRESSOR OF GENE SILENCING [Trifolium repens]